MVAASPIFSNPVKRRKKTKGVEVPTIDFSQKHEERGSLSHLIVEACEEFGMFKVVNHGVSHHTISTLEKHGLHFFSQPASVKQQWGPNKATSPFGYGSRNIGPNGDMGELEYLLLHANIPSTHPPSFRWKAKKYVGEVKELACEVLEMMGEGLGVGDTSIFSALLTHPHSDSLLRLNHYPNLNLNIDGSRSGSGSGSRVGFGEHSDPHILTILRSNDVGGLQICMPDGGWVPLPPDPSAFFVMVGDALQVLTNGRFVSVKHRVAANDGGDKGRMSIMYFGAPPLNALICPIKEMVSPLHPTLYKPFTWGEYKRAMRTSRLSDCRLSLFKTRNS